MRDSFFEFKPLSFRGEVAIVSPSSPFDRQLFNAGITELKLNKIKPVIKKEIFQKFNIFAGSDTERASMILSAFTNKSIEAIWTARGGYGSIRLLEVFDKHREEIIENPKLFIGFSDVTAIHSWLIEKCGFVTVHAPNITTFANCDKYSKKQVFDLLQGKDSAFDIYSKNMTSVVPGTAKGVVKGGNLSTLISLIGTPYDPDFKDSVLFLEEVGEVPYRVDRMITHMRLAGKFKGVRAVVLGDFSYREFRPPATKQVNPSKIVEAMGLDRSVPVVANFPAGHGRQNMAFLLGAVAEIDAVKHRLRYSVE